MAAEGDATRISVTVIRDDLASVVNRVAFGGERIVLERRGKDVAALVPMNDLRRLEEMEDAHWAKEADGALADAARRGERPLPFAKVERRIEAARRTRPRRSRAAK